MDMRRSLGWTSAGASESVDDRRRRLRKVNLQLRSQGFVIDSLEDPELADVADGLLASFREKTRLLAEHHCPADRRIEAFLAEHFADLKLAWRMRLPDQTVVLEEHGIARELSLPIHGDSFTSPLLTSYRVRNGVLHNPKSDRRTTEGTFHVTEGGLPVPGDKRAVPKRTFAELYYHAMHPPVEMMTLPFMSDQAEPAKSFVSLLLRPTVCPEVPGVCPAKSMEVRFFAPGTLVSNLDFVESIFGNAGDPYLPQNDAGLDVEHWIGVTGCVILAPQLVELTKKQVGLPHYDHATERQRRDKMCYRDEKEKYNDGVPFKLTCRTQAGVIVTLIADNYFGYCKKEVKTQISYAANLYGNVEEEHAGGAMAFTSYAFGDQFVSDSRRGNGRVFADVLKDYRSLMHVQPEGYGVDKVWPDLIYIPEESTASVAAQSVNWKSDGQDRAIPMMPGKIYMTPSGFKLRLEKHPGAPSWRIIGTVGEGTFCHKPCTVSGGGKSEISKSISDYKLYGPIFVADIDKDFALIDQIITRNYSDRWKSPEAAKANHAHDQKSSRPLLSAQRSLGSVIKLLTPSADYSDGYNGWLASLPNYIYPMVFIIKRFYRPEWGQNWRDQFGVDVVNGFNGHELKFGDRQLVGTYLRMGLTKSGNWRTYKLRQDFAAAVKIQTEDDISASVVVPRTKLAKLSASQQATSCKFVINCEYRLFQRPDDAIHRGLDKQTELDLSRHDNFISNFEPLDVKKAKELVAKVTTFDRYTHPMQRILEEAATAGKGYVVSSSEPRLVDGKPSKNPRYLQNRPDLVTPFNRYVAEQGIRFSRAVPLQKPVLTPVDSVLVGRRNNPADPAAGIRPLAVYNPIHYQELPELFMDFVCSLTGKSPSTTGAGSEGALTKGPFNAVRPIVDLNNALVSYILTGLGGFSSSAGFIGPGYRVDHDVSLMVPELWCRLTPEERDPKKMIAAGFLEPLKDFDHKGETILASRLGYRITAHFVRTYFGRLFDNPSKVFEEAILRPETQDRDQFIDGIKNITEAQTRVAKQYIEDGSIEDACPPLKALLMIMATGSFEGKDVHHASIRSMFTHLSLIKSDWYQARLRAKQKADIDLWKRHLSYIEQCLVTPAYRELMGLDLASRKAFVNEELDKTISEKYLDDLIGTLGLDPSTMN